MICLWPYLDTLILIQPPFSWWHLPCKPGAWQNSEDRQDSEIAQGEKIWSLGSGRYTLGGQMTSRKDAIYWYLFAKKDNLQSCLFWSNDLIIGRKRTNFGGYLGIDSRIWPNLKLLRPKSRLIRSFHHRFFFNTPPKINIEAENDGLEDVFPFPGVYSQVPC